MVGDQTCAWRVFCKYVCSVRFVLAQMTLYLFSLLEIYCVHSGFGISICSVLGVPVVEHFIAVTLHAKEIKKYRVKAFP